VIEMSGPKKKDKEAVVATVVSSVNKIVKLTISVPGRDAATIMPAQATISKTFARDLRKRGLKKDDEVMVHFPVENDLQSGMVLGWKKEG